MIKRDIVVVGASAGGLKALTQVIKDLPSTLEASVLIVMHLYPHSPSLLPDILQKSTTLTVVTPKDGQAIRRHHIYVAPPNCHMLVAEDGRIRLIAGPRVNHSRPAIDPLFCSVALHYGARAIGVILTGTLDDGSAGLELIKKHGGLAVVQDPDDAEYPDMPRNALDNVEVDQCLPLEEIALFIKQAINTSVEINSIETKPSGIGSTLSVEELNRLGKISTFTCPECHGALWEINKQGMLHYCCRIGHSFGPQSLLAVHDETTEKILWSAVRTLEENAELSLHIATHADKKNAPTAKLFHHKAETAAQDARKLEEILLKRNVTAG